MNSELKDLCFTKAISKLLTALKNLKIHLQPTQEPPSVVWLNSTLYLWTMKHQAE